MQELLFGGLKFGDLNPEGHGTGKKSLALLANMVARRLAAIPRSVAVRYWHQAVLHHYGALFFERL